MLMMDGDLVPITQAMERTDGPNVNALLNPPLASAVAVNV
jgi:hypothetical protein